MTLRHFRIFLAVCETLNMTQAARQLHISQPSVTQAIHEMENHYGLMLFERLGRHIYLTAAISGSVPCLKYTVISTTPAFEAVEVI